MTTLAERLRFNDQLRVYLVNHGSAATVHGVERHPQRKILEALTRATASDHYSPPSLGGKRPGIFWSVVNDPTQYQSTKMTTPLLHEGSPGHHFQLALQQEMRLPDFRKFAFQSAFSEGWALYAETLGKEMGLFDKPDQYFGHLNDELLARPWRTRSAV